MTWTDETLRRFGWNVQRLIEKRNLTREESYEMFRQVLLNQQPDLQQGAFLAALVSKTETPQEIAGAWEAIVELDTAPVSGRFAGPLVENSGTGMDQLKTFNVSSAAAVVAAAGGARMARHGARALTSSCGTVDLLEAIGIDVDCRVETVERSIREAGIGLFNGMSPKIHPQSLARILGQIRFGSTLNIAASLASPCRPSHALRGVYSEAMIARVCGVMKEIGYERAMVVHGFDSQKEKGMDELSVIGESVIQEFYPDGSEEGYTLAPEDVGIERTRYDEISAIGDVKREAVRFMKVISGTGHPACIDFTCFNGGAILYLIGKVDDIKKGVETCREIIGSGQALQKLSQWVSTQTDRDEEGLGRFLDVAVSADLRKEVSQFI
jgi:anthranilate phosphoribosyltransferase